MPRLTPPASLLLLLLAACVRTAAPPATAFRPAAAGLWSVAAFVPARLDGRWRQVAAYSAAETPGCRPGGAEFTRRPGGLTIAARLCLNGREVTVSGPVGAAGPGRLAVPGMADWWVIWVDSGYRTLAVATPDGSFGFVLDRGAIPSDRLTAAAEIFAFNGYSRARLRPF
ncbi:lipocalin family protein [Rhodobacter sp. Har01]|uniref:lipocalin family protein n=1 Tax=Rhodobacter sp. Har01 TaxID=2883999 RepID=UPI001D06C299|nr:lipocalin family protein [Rhodobacter sp. Har01]MCB6178358.1 lipocalin family protein [Rhodobacter sp. Har01]